MRIERPDLRELMRLAEATTPGPWSYRTSHSHGASVEAEATVAWCGTNAANGAMPTHVISSREAHANARFVAAAHEAIPALVAWVDHLEVELALVKRDLELLEERQ